MLEGDLSHAEGLSEDQRCGQVGVVGRGGGHASDPVLVCGLW